MADDLIAGRYLVLEPLGRGAMSSVWLAEDRELERRVAVKTLAPTADRERFEREARAAASLQHPNICALYAFGEAGGKLYMVLEYLPGGSLEERLSRGEPLSDAETLVVARQLAAGLAHAHERGLVHRDLKPANILFDAEGRAKIADFGIARMASQGTLTETGTVLGTASYISPEQAAGLPAGPPSDVYSFGVVLFRMLTGRLPFLSTNAMELVRAHRDDPAPSVASVRPDAPPRLAALADSALVKDPAHRPPDGRALARELSGDERAPATQPGRSRRRPPAALVLLGAAVTLLLAGGGALALLTTAETTGGRTTVRGSVVRPSTSTQAVPSSQGTLSAQAPSSATTGPSGTTTAASTAASATAPPTTAAVSTAVATTAAGTPTVVPATTTATTTTRATTTAPTTTAAQTTTAPTSTAGIVPSTTTTTTATTTAP